MHEFNQFVFQTIAYFGFVIIGAFFWLGIIQIALWIVKGVRWVYRKVTGKQPVEKPVRLPKVSGEHHQEMLRIYQERIDRAEARGDEYFEKYLDAAYPHRVERRKAEQQAAAQAEFERLNQNNEHAEAVLDTDE